MKAILTSIFTCFCLLSYSQTQYEMNMEAGKVYQKADSELNSIYKKILILYKKDTLFIKHLKKSQKLWVQFKDAEMEMKFPNYNIPGWYGSMQPMCWNYYLENLIRERIKTLREWIEGIDNQDGCRGSALSKYLIENPKEMKEYFDDFNQYNNKNMSK